jgi:AraC family transcriptional regulator
MPVPVRKRITLSLDDGHGTTAPGLAISRSAATDATPTNFLENVGRFRMTSLRSVGIGAKSSLKASFWASDLEDSHVSGDPGYASVLVHCGGGRVWRNNEPIPGEPGSVSMQPFEDTRWRLEGMVQFAHVFVPFALLGDVCQSLFDREFKHDQLWIPMGTRDERLCGPMSAVQAGLISLEPTNLILDSWALILSDVLVRGFSSHAQKRARASFGKIPARGIAHAVDYIEASIDQDLDLGSLASVAAMSVYHFAHRLKETVGVSPHAYILTRRIRRAQGMLRVRSNSLADVAATCGFSSQAHFTTAFLRSTGVTPGQYRRSVASDPA